MPVLIFGKADSSSCDLLRFCEANEFTARHVLVGENPLFL